MILRFETVIAIVLALVSTNCTHAQKLATAGAATSLRPIPSEDKRASGVNTLRQVYEIEYRRAEDKNELKAQLDRSNLARKLLTTAKETAVDNVTYYPMLSEAIDWATLGGKPDVAFECINLLLRTHAIDASKSRLKVLTQFARKESRLGDVLTAGPLVMPSIQAAANAQKLETALSITTAGDAIANRLNDRSLQKELARARELLILLQQQQADFEAAMKLLQQKPNDASANLTLAKFMGLRKSDWEVAEGFAAHVDENDVRSLFVREHAVPKGIAESLQLASDWWTFADRLSGAEQLQAMEVAVSHYALIVKDLQGIDKKEAAVRLAKVIKKHAIPVRVWAFSETGEPSPVIAPFDAEVAKRNQKEWADYLGVSVETSNSIGVDFVFVPPGTFVMGSPESEPGRKRDERQHEVTISGPFFLSRCEVTQEQYQRIMLRNTASPKSFNLPAEASWDDAVEFCRRLTELNAENIAGNIYRLPTEAEWEYACRAGTTTAYSFGANQRNVSDYCWWSGNSSSKTHPIGEKKKNPWGLCDMHGNMWEWVEDWYGAYPSAAVVDPKGPESGIFRVARGHSFHDIPGRTAHRSGELLPSFRNNNTGFRVVMVPSSFRKSQP